MKQWDETSTGKPLLEVDAFLREWVKDRTLDVCPRPTHMPISWQMYWKLSRKNPRFIGGSLAKALYQYA